MNVILQIWKYTFAKLGASPEERPILLTEAPFNPQVNREKTTDVTGYNSLSINRYPQFAQSEMCVNNLHELSVQSRDLDIRPTRYLKPRISSYRRILSNDQSVFAVFPSMKYSLMSK